MKKFLLTVYLLLLGVSLFAQLPENEISALKDLYTATQGDSWNQQWDLNEFQWD